jgi:hypothetical protein
MNPITYCMNVHPGEDIASIRNAISDIALPLRTALEHGCEMPLGLRLSADAAQALRVPETMRSFCSFLQANRLKVMGINGFPYGAFHGTTVKEAVYAPDWQTVERQSYTHDLFYAATHLPVADLGEHRFSVSTVPLAYDRGQKFSDQFLENICAFALFLRKLEGFTGRRLCLALEPEPDCLLDGSQSVIDFFEELWRHPDWHPAYRDLIGVCFDTCHFAVNYEDPLYALRHIVSSNIPVARIQISAALEFTPYATVEDLTPFVDPVYLHQTIRREHDASMTCYPDLTSAILPELIGARGRIHYHVPLVWPGNSHITSTRNALTPAFWRYVRAGAWPLEIETYTYNVLPADLRHRTLSEMLFEDIAWVRSQLCQA